MVDPGSAVVSHRLHRRMPRHAELPGQLSHRVALTADPAADLGPSPLGERSPRSDGIGVLRSSLHRAVRVRAAPQPLAPHQHDPPAMGRSRTRTVRRPWPTALVPQPSQPTTPALVSTISSSSPSPSTWRPPRTRPCPEARWRHGYGASPQGPPIVSTFDSRNNGEVPASPRGPLCGGAAQFSPPRFIA